MDLQKKNAFTLAEMMIVLLVISLTMAAFLPVMTKRTRAAGGTSNPWLWAENKIDAVFNEGDTSGAIIGATAFDAADSARLLISTHDAAQSHIIFKQANVLTGFLEVDNAGRILLGEGTLPGSGGANDIVIGEGANSTHPGGSSIAIGGRSEVNGFGSVAIGGSSTAGIQTGVQGHRGVAIGYSTNIEADDAIAIGTGATTSGGSAIAIGASGTEASGGDSIAIGRTAKATRTYATAIGDQVVSNGLGAIAIGYTTTPGSSTTASGENSISIGLAANVNDQNLGGIAIGHGAKANNTLNLASIAIGRYANSPGGVSLGALAGQYNTGYGNTAIGLAALQGVAGKTATGMANTAVGNAALLINRNGNNNTAVGSSALQNNTTNILGFTGNNNTAIGANAMLNSDTGDDNTAIGYQALTNGGSSNTAIGAGACANVTGSNKTCIGAGSGPLASHPNFDSDAIERIFIGKPSRQIKFDDCNAVSAAASVFWSWLTGQTTTCNVRTRALPSNSAIVEIHNNASDTSDDSATVVINANLIIRGQTWFTDYEDNQARRMYDDAGFEVHSSFRDLFYFDGTYVSDRNLKNVGEEYNSGLDKLKALKTYHYTFKKDKKKIPHVGVMAQDLQKVFPDAVMKGKDGFLKIRMEDMFYSMMNAIKELDMIVQGLVKDVKSLVARVQTVDDKVVALMKVDQINVKKIKELEHKNALLEKQNKNFEARLRKLEQR